MTSRTGRDRWTGNGQRKLRIDGKEREAMGRSQLTFGEAEEVPGLSKVWRNAKSF